MKELEEQMKRLEEVGIFVPYDPNSGGVKENNLADKLQAVLDDFDKTWNDNLGALPPDRSTWNEADYASHIGKVAYQWMLDGQDQIVGGGKINNNISNAVTAGQTLNDNQKDELNEVTYVFEQFQKIAAAVMTALNETIKKFASGAGRT